MLLTERLKTPQLIIPATFGTIVLTMLLPILIHSIPAQGAPMGARLLPIFIAPLVAIYLFHPAVAIITSLVTPYLNHTLTGMPPIPMMLMLTGELIIFSLICISLKRFKFWFVAPLAYITAKGLTLALLKATNITSTFAWSTFLPALQIALPGLIILLILNFFLNRLITNG